ncbi:hypothetical protein FDF18_12515 [Clostridium sporogenes]|uniref:hypothetical protein n=1 Tax=Clostridium sporogenes TaxID=1509 RepID=UPI0013CA45E4|nr:hypothetical protein [Clostridium sporogenes]MCW6111623.1 hypothetical protein [Clostridium sporogenes]NFT04106.1 hypothetical protein [Clostridium sporogenes]NFT31291.1 hypothetical protein [Clostridium sporogenes]NFT39530.1 hypothetical protein [Clostridium sporogenes]NFT54599.1 hypothetical protein [Clostridium sporogenes]
MGLDDLVEKIEELESSIYEVKENLNDVKVTILKVLEILESSNDGLDCTNPDLSADLDYAMELLNELIDED